MNSRSSISDGSALRSTSVQASLTTSCRSERETQAILIIDHWNLITICPPLCLIPS